MRQARAIATSLGLSELPVAEYPGQIATDSAEEFKQKILNEVVPQIIERLVTPVKADAASPAEQGPRDIVFRGSWEEVNEYFYENLWTDGLPIVPPTIDKVEEFLRFTDHRPDEVIGVLAPERREATVWNVAVNGVMAGCRPEYMPILLAAVECVADPEFRIEDSGSTPGWEPLIILNGPLVKELDFNSEVGAMRVGKKANTSIGRFLNLYFRNVAGLRPGLTSKGTIGASFNVVLAENEEAAEEIGWKPFSADTRGFQKGENVVTVQSVVSVTGPTYSSGDTAMGHLEYLKEFIGESTSLLWSTRTGLLYDKWFPLFVISPRIARVIAGDGWTKANVRQYFYDHCKIPAGLLERYAHQPGFGDGRHWTLCEEVANGKLPKEYCESDDPNRLIRVFMRPEWIEIVVAGDPARNQARGYMNNHEQGAPVSRRVQLPTKWSELLPSSGRVLTQAG